MVATTEIGINKEEFIEKVEKAKKLLDDVPAFDCKYVIDDILIKRIFEIACLATKIIDKTIPISWLEKQAQLMEEQDLDAMARNLRNVLKEWEKEGEKEWERLKDIQ